MNKLILRIVCLLGLSALSLNAGPGGYSSIIKVNKGTEFLKPGQKLVGYLDRNSVCGAQGAGLGAEACAVVSAKVPRHFKRGVTIPGTRTFYYTKEVYVTGTPAPNLVGFIEGSTIKGKGMGGDKAIGVFQANNMNNKRDLPPNLPGLIKGEPSDHSIIGGVPRCVTEEDCPKPLPDTINVRPTKDCPPSK